MNRILSTAVLTALFAGCAPDLCAADIPAKEPPELIVLRARFQNDLQQTLKPIQSQYVSELQVMVNALTRKGDLDDALAVQKEMKNPGANKEPVEKPAEFVAAKATYESAVKAKASVIQQNFILQLESLTKTLSQRADLAGALAVKAEVQKQEETTEYGVKVNGSTGQASSAPGGLERFKAQLKGTVWKLSTHPVQRLTFGEDGFLHASWHNKAHPWRVAGVGHVEAAFNNTSNVPAPFIFDPELTTMKVNNVDVWNRVR